MGYVAFDLRRTAHGERPLRRFRRVSLPASLLALAFAGFVAGCGDDDGPTAPEAPADTFTVATTPAAAAERLLETYEAQNLARYAGNLTTDFRFIFSSQADPDLVAEYGETWGADDETAAANHLFNGFVDDQGQYQPAAVTVESAAPFIHVFVDSTHLDSLAHYARVAIPRLLLEMTLEDDRGFNVDAPFNVFVVRGDAARLGPGQAPDSTLWYIRRFEDLSSALSRARLPATPSSWGSIRAQYLR